MKQFLETLCNVNLYGRLYPDRTGKGRIRVFGGLETYDLSVGFPVVTTRKLYLKSLVKELLGFIAGSNKVSELGEAFWGKWSPTKEDVEAELENIKKDAVASGNEDMIKMYSDERQMNIIRNYLSSHIGTIGPMYGVMWRKFPRVNSQIPDWYHGVEDLPSDVKTHLQEEFLKQVMLSQGGTENNEKNWKAFATQEYFKTYDQLNMVYLNLKRNPFSSRHRVTAYHPDITGTEQITPKQNVMAGGPALTPCHSFFQFMVTERHGDDGEMKKTLNCMFYMSSSDVMVGRPYNICQYALLTMMMAHCLDYLPGKLTIVSCDTHIYAHHEDAANVQLDRAPGELAQLILPKDKKDFFAFKPEDIIIEGYDPALPIPLEVAV